MYDVKETELAGRMASQVPDPVGFHLLVALPKVQEKTEGGIIRPDETRQREETAAVIGWVMKVGPACYTDKRIFDAPWCKQGDWVLFRPYTGIRIVVHGQEFRIMKDSEIAAVVENPAGLVRSQRV